MEKRFLCTDCGKLYKHQESLSRHKNSCGNNTKKFCCPYCPHRTTRKDNLRSHIYHIHKFSNDMFFHVQEISDIKVIQFAPPTEEDE